MCVRAGAWEWEGAWVGCMCGCVACLSEGSALSMARTEGCPTTMIRVATKGPLQ